MPPFPVPGITHACSSRKELLGSSTSGCWHGETGLTVLRACAPCCLLSCSPFSSTPPAGRRRASPRIRPFSCYPPSPARRRPHRPARRRSRSPGRAAWQLRPATTEGAIGEARAKLDVPDLMAEPFTSGGDWTAQWRGTTWWLVGVYRSPWGKRFVVRATVSGRHVRFGAGAMTPLRHAGGVQPGTRSTTQRAARPERTSSLPLHRRRAAPWSRRRTTPPHLGRPPTASGISAS